jgi:hypothetical protein
VLRGNLSKNKGEAKGKTCADDPEGRLTRRKSAERTSKEKKLD